MSRSGSRRMILGIELLADRFKLAQFQTAGGGLSLVKAHVEVFGTDDGSLAQRLAAALESEGFAKAPVLACLPRQVVTVRIIELPSTDPAEIADMVHLQMGKQTPYSEEEIVSDYRILGAGREGYSRVMLAIVQRTVLRHHYHTIESAGLTVARMSVSSEGILNWYRRAGNRPSGDAADVLLDVDAGSADVTVMAGGMPVFSRGILIGAEALAGGDDAPKAQLCQEAQRCLETCRAEAADLTVGKILLTGAGPKVAGLSGLLKEKLGVDVEARDAVAELVTAGERPEDSGTASFTALAGMAAAPEDLAFNLIPGSVTLRRSLTRKAKGLTLFGILLMAVLVSASVYTSVRMSFKQARLNALQARYRATEADAREVERRHDLVKLVNRRRDARFAALTLLSELHNRLPPELALEEIVLDVERDAGQVRLAGNAAERTDVSALVRNLEASALLQNVQTEGTTSRDRETGRYAFRVTASLEE
ncbi:MAG: PilN domain-containing protein [Lentisphaerae bacterium]|nr:PilN domain-containing protein [Lentisphaerota bacterium]